MRKGPRYEFVGGPMNTEHIPIDKIDGKLPPELHAKPTSSFEPTSPDYEGQVIQVPMYQRLTTQPTIWSGHGHYTLRLNGYNPLLSTYEWVDA